MFQYDTVFAPLLRWDGTIPAAAAGIPVARDRYKRSRQAYACLLSLSKKSPKGGFFGIMERR